MISIITRIVFLVSAILFISCAKQMAEQSAKPDSTKVQQPTEQMGAATAPLHTSRQAPQSSQDIVEIPQSQIPDSIRQKLLDAQSSKNMPVGSMPQLRASVLAQFHPKVKDFTMTKNKDIEDKGIAQSIYFFRYNNDTSRTLRSIIIDQDERVANKLIREMTELRKTGIRIGHSEGEEVTAYYCEVNGAPAIKSYIPSKTVATLTILCGDHRVIALREYKATSVDHLLEVAKTINTKKLSEMMP